jgi:DNA-binding NtrC family response regulator
MAKILVVDDDPNIRMLLRQILERAGYEVVEAPNGQVGTNLYRESPTDVVITDILMPEKSGWEAILELRADFPEVKVIAISGGGTLGPFSYLMLAKRFGARHVFSKPLEKNRLLAAVEDLISNREPASENRRDREGNQGEKKSILLVDPDPKHTWTLCEGLTRAGHSVTDTPEPESALSILQERVFDIAILDVLSTKTDEMDLIEILKKNWGRTIIIAMADFQFLAVRKAVIRRGANHFINKPVDLDYILTIISPPPSFSGKVDGIDILEYIQLTMLAGKTSLLKIQSEAEGWCELYFEKGNIVHAVSGQVEGVEAFFQCSSFKGGKFANLPWTEPLQTTINKPGDVLLMEAARRRDEQKS